MAMATPPPSPGDTTVKVPPAPDVKFRCTDQRGWSNPTGEVLRPLAEGVWVAERAFMPGTCRFIGQAGTGGEGCGRGVVHGPCRGFAVVWPRGFR